MFCQQCGNNVKEGAAFCGNCGWAVPAAAVQTAVLPIEKKCASCGTVLKDEAQFCPNCGQAVAAEIRPDPVCSSCGEKIIQGNKFCIKCGTAVDTSSVPNIPPPTSINQDEPENILLKAMVTAEQEYPYGTNNGNLIITNKRVVFKSSRLLNVDLFGEADSDLSFYYNEIAEFKYKKFNLAIEIITKNGYKIKFAGFGKIKTAYEIICEKMKSYV